MDDSCGLYEDQGKHGTRFHGGKLQLERPRWTDDQRHPRPLATAVIVFVSSLLFLGVLGPLHLMTSNVISSPFPVKSGRERRHGTDESVANSQQGTGAALDWPKLSQRQAIPQPPSQSDSSIQAFQVDVPILGQEGMVVGAGTRDGFRGIQTVGNTSAAACQVTLAVNVFNNSFGSPFVADYVPPACVSQSNTAVINLTVTSRGRQFDRLAILYLGSVEIFRTSTEEPRTQGISWTYMKDMSHYMALWKQPQTVIFDLPNIVDPTMIPPLTGTYNTTLAASFFRASQPVNPADTIIPISARQSDNTSSASQPSVFTIPSPDVSASNVITKFPRNVVRAIFSVSATGQANEEFWWSNVLQSDTQTYNASTVTLFGYSPFREVQVLIDGQLAGVQWPFPVIFTGGVVPSLWSPIVGIDAFDLKEGEIDISPWLGVLCDGQPHNISIRIVGLNDDGSTNATLSPNTGDDWQVTGKIFAWLDADAAAVTTGAAPNVSGKLPAIAVSQTLMTNTTGYNDTLRYTTSVSRDLSVSGSITTSSGTRNFTWTQVLSHTDNGTLSNAGNNQIVSIMTNGTDTSTTPKNSFISTYSYPLNANITSEVLTNGTTRVFALLSRTKSANRTMDPDGGEGLVSPSGLQLFAALSATVDLVGRIKETSLTTTQSGSAVLLVPANGSSTGYGGQSQTMRFGGGTAAGVLGDEPDTELYFRSVSVNSTGAVLDDVERLAGENIMGMRLPATGK